MRIRCYSLWKKLKGLNGFGEGRSETQAYRMSFITHTIKPSSNGVVVETTFDALQVLKKMKEASKGSYARYGNVFENCSIDLSESKGYSRIKLKHEAYEDGLPWITADKVFVPYNEELMISCIYRAIEYVIANSERLSAYESRDWVDTIGNRAFSLYCDSEYYKTKYMEVSEAWSAKCKELYNEPEVLARCEKAEGAVARKEERIASTVREIDYILANLPKSTTQKLRSDIENLKYTLGVRH